MSGFTDIYLMIILFLSITGIMYGAVILTYDNNEPGAEIESVTTQPSPHADNETQFNTTLSNQGTSEITEQIKLQNETSGTLDTRTETIPPNTTRTITLNATETQLQNTSRAQVVTPKQNYTTPPHATQKSHNDTGTLQKPRFKIEGVGVHTTQSYSQNPQVFTTSIQNNGSQAGTSAVQLTKHDTVNGTREVLYEEEVFLEMNETKTVSFEHESNDERNQILSAETPTDSHSYYEHECSLSSNNALETGIKETLERFFGVTEPEHDENNC